MSDDADIPSIFTAIVILIIFMGFQLCVMVYTLN